ncbi:MAG: S9 family peptidase [Synechococcales bacterium]|nr:S9 family peptidase [Synechococcales bacterium]
MFNSEMNAVNALSVASYGTWKSPISSDLIVAGTIGLGQIAIEGDQVFWQESRPTEAGRTVVVKRATGARGDRPPEDSPFVELNSAPFNVRTRVHEYGGGAYTVADGVLYFCHFADQRIYWAQPGESPIPITPEGRYRYADLKYDRAHHRLIAIREDHSQPDREAVNTIVGIPLAGCGQIAPELPEPIGQEPIVLVEGHDFFASPHLSQDGRWLTWITWDHPNMPWDGTELWIAAIQADGSLAMPEKLAGGQEESIFQPQWGPDDRLYFISDRTGWWNLYRWHSAHIPGVAGEIEMLCPKEAEFGLPQWVFGMSTYGFISPTELVCTYSERGLSHLARFDLSSLELTEIPTPYSSVSGLQTAAGIIAFLGGSVTEPTAIVQMDAQTLEYQVLRRATDLQIDPGYLSEPEPIAFPTENGLTAYAFYYPPTNRDFNPPAGEKPPLLVKSHGGPTAATSASFELRIQYWTSRGFGVLDVNYGGSTGYGRAYRERLRGNWGIVDVDDCANGAKFLVEQGRVDGDRLVIAGGSAGGFTTLCALTFRDVFKAGASYYGVSDLKILAEDTHKFESRYLDSIIGPYPDRADLYHDRSPIHAIDRLSCPVIFFQGDEDRVVPPNQSELMANALREKGVPVAYVLFAGEQHGFRKAENIKRALDGEFYFYARVFGFQPADAIEPIAIEGMPNGT